MPTIQPFQNESDSFQIDDLTIENRLDRVELYGSLQVTKDKAGLKAAKELKAIIDATVTALEHENLPDQFPIKPTDKVKNPFD